MRLKYSIQVNQDRPDMLFTKKIFGLILMQ